jgi:REP element-mobilizing transposase RayT
MAIVIAHHLVWTGYGHWLPNDPRGSGSIGVAWKTIADLGEHHFGRRKLQPAAKVIRDFYERAKKDLKFPLLTFGHNERVEIAAAFADCIVENRYTCYACAIMPDHVHLVIRKHRDQAEDMIEKIQAVSRQRFLERQLAQPDHPVWTLGGWKDFLHTPDDIRRAIRYVENYPVKIGLPQQHWPFVKEYDGWPLHPGHSPNSPYARGLRGY